MRISFFLIFLLLGCQSNNLYRKDSATKGAAETASDNASQEKEDVADQLKNFIRSRNMKEPGVFSNSLFSILKKAKLVNGSKEVVLLDLFCQIQAIGESVVSRCNFMEKKAGRWNKRMIQGEVAEELRLELSRFPVSLGESGASVSFLRCLASEGKAKCEIALDLNYEGP